MLSRCSGCFRQLFRRGDVRPALDLVRSATGTLLSPKSVRGTVSLCKNIGWRQMLSGLTCQELPNRVIFLNGPPGSGKTEALDIVRSFSGIQTAYTMSSVISRHKTINADTLKSMSGLAGDDVVCSALTATIRTAPMGTRELILDGFPRSESQVDYLEQLIHHVHASKAQNGVAEPELDVCMVVLHVDEKTSIKRQMDRQQKAEIHNAAVRSCGEGTFMEERTTDKSASLCRDRYEVFARSEPALKRVESMMKVYHIDASRPLDVCRHDIASVMIQHRRQRSQSPLKPTSSAAWRAAQQQAMQAPSHGAPASTWWSSWSKWVGGSQPSSVHGSTVHNRSGWTPYGVVWN